jgi:hypothetical protein
MRQQYNHIDPLLNYLNTLCFKRLLSHLVFVCSLFFGAHDSLSQTISKEDQVKAAYIFNFTKFTTWPESSFANPKSPIIIGIYEKDPFGVLIDELVKDELVKGRSIVIKRIKRGEQISPCHVLYVHRSNKIDPDEILTSLRGEGVLTLSDIDDFTKKGGIVKFYQDDGKMKFEVNAQEVSRSGITISSRLLRLAEMCCEERDQKPRNDF